MSIRRRLARLASFAVLPIATLGAACTTDVAPYSSDADERTTHAMITIERSASANDPATIRGAALAGFVHMSSVVEAESALRLVGLSNGVPPIGQCRSTGLDPESARAPSSLEFMEAGEVRVATASGGTQLTARAFPAITDVVSGVVYTTPDRSANLLPADSPYTVWVRGDSSIPSLSVSTHAPRELEGVAVSGIPLAELSSFAVGQPTSIIWQPGSAADQVVIELAPVDGSAGAICSFRDSGSAVLPAGVIESVGPGALTVHRVRSHYFAHAGIDRGELRFDFSTRANVNFVP